MSDRLRRAALVLIAGVVGCVACSDDDGGAATTTPLTALAPAPTVSPATVPPPGTGEAAAVAPDGFSLVTIVVVDADGNEHVLCVWLADSAAERQRGLMGVTDLAGADGMLFSYSQSTDSNFWMFGTPMPLSIAFFDDDGSFVSSADMMPCLDTPTDECRRYPAEAPYTRALEVPQGGLERLGVTPASRLQAVADEIEACPST